MPISNTDLQELAKVSLDEYLRNLPVDQIAVERPFLKKLMEGRKSLLGAKQNVVESDASARRYVMQQLFDKVNEDETSESGKLRALELIGKAVGMFTDRVEQVTETINADELKKELESHLHLLDNAKKKITTIQ